MTDLKRQIKENDFAVWSNRLHILCADFRDIRAVEVHVLHSLHVANFFTHYIPTVLGEIPLRTFGKARYSHQQRCSNDSEVNTLGGVGGNVLCKDRAKLLLSHRPREFYEHLRQTEETPVFLLAPSQQSLLATDWNDAALRSSNGWSLSSTSREETDSKSRTSPDCGDDSVDHYFPTGVLTNAGEQVDLRPWNSWSIRLHQLSTREFLEVQVRVWRGPSALRSIVK